MMADTPVSEQPKATPSVFSGNRVRLGGSAPIPVPADGLAQPGDPSIRLVRHGEDIQAIDIACRCGCHMRIVCEYDNPAPS